MKKFAHWIIPSAIALVAVLFLQVALPIARTPINALLGRVGIKSTFTIGMAGTAYAATADYVVDGAADDVQAQAALNALPNTGGKLIFYAGNYVFTATVARAIPNVTIEGSGKATYFAYNGSTPSFSAGSQAGWVFKDFRTDAGYLTVANDTRVVNVNNGSYTVAPTGAATFIVASATATANEKANANWICDGTADETEINAAIAALPTQGGTVLLTSGTFVIAAPVNLNSMPDNTWLKGQGTSTVLQTSTDINTIDATPASNVNYLSITDLTIDTTGAIKASKAGIVANNLRNYTFARLYIHNQYDSMVVGASTGVNTGPGTIADIYTTSYTHAGLWTDNVSVLDIQNYVGDNNPAAQSDYGWYITGSCNGINAFDVDMIHSGSGVRIVAGAGNTILWLQLHVVAADSGDDWGWYIDPSGGVIDGINAVDCWSGSNKCGVAITGGTGITFDSSRIIENDEYGLVLDGGAHITISDSQVIDNNKTNNPTYHGIIVNSGVSDFLIEGNQIGNILGTGHQRYGVVVGAGGSDYYNITNNHVHENVSGGVYDMGTGIHKTVTGNY